MAPKFRSFEMAPKFQQSLSCLSTTPLPSDNRVRAALQDEISRVLGLSMLEDSFQNTASFMEASKFPKYFHDVHVQIRPGRTPAPAILIASRREEGVEYPLFTSDS
ncbi:hypothetical protein Bbelb_338460 [Branchiostoma belcheri]|nr:hypothetical protein Bbelb_338460 [Branchiostoma belcheri]